MRARARRAQLTDFMRGRLPTPSPVRLRRTEPVLAFVARLFWRTKVKGLAQPCLHPFLSLKEKCGGF